MVSALSLVGVLVLFFWAQQRQAHSLFIRGYRSFPSESTAGIELRNLLISATNYGYGRTALYILGGAGESQFLKFQKAASIYKQGVGPTVWVMHVDGITTFDPELSRNLTEDEWTLRELTRAGVPPDAIEFQRIEDRFFGTFSEARTLAVLCHEKQITTLLLVCAGYHARRVEVTFSALLSAGAVKIEIYPTDESASAIGLLYEYVKKEWYETVLIPLWQRKNRTLPKRENQSMPAELGRTTYIDRQGWDEWSNFSPRLS